MEPALTIAICTKDRPESLKRTLASTCSTTGNCEILVIDQSVDPGCEGLVAEQNDARLRYVRNRANGLSESRNLVLRAAKSEYIVFTDDDCLIAPTWAWDMKEKLAQTGAALVFCGVEPSSSVPGFTTPSYRPSKERLHRSFRTWCLLGRGMGAGMAVRRGSARKVGGFDPLLGKGAIFGSYEDLDLATRLVLTGHSLLECPSLVVAHDGALTLSQTREALLDVYRSRGARLSKLFRQHPVHAGWQCLRELWDFNLLIPGAVTGRHNHSLYELVKAFSKGLSEGNRIRLSAHYTYETDTSRENL